MRRVKRKEIEDYHKKLLGSPTFMEAFKKVIRANEEAQFKKSHAEYLNVYQRFFIKTALDFAILYEEAARERGILL